MKPATIERWGAGSRRALRMALVLTLLGHALAWVMLHPRRAHQAGAPHRTPFKVRLAAAHSAPEPPVLPQPVEPLPQTVAAEGHSALPPSTRQAAWPSSAKVAPSASDVSKAWLGTPPAPSASTASGVSPEVERAILAMVPESYLPVDELDVTPELLGNWRLNEAAIPKGGNRPDRLVVTLRLWVSDQGHIDAFQLLSVQPSVPWIDDYLKTLDLSTLRPALKNGDPVPARWEIEMELDLSGSL